MIEQAILGYLLNNNSMDSQLLRPGLFSSNKNKLIFKTIRDMKDRGHLINPIIIVSKLGKKGITSSYTGECEKQLILGRFQEGNFKDCVNKLIQLNKEQELKRLVSKRIEESDFIPDLKEALSAYEVESLEPIESFSISARAAGFIEHLEKKRSGKLWGHRIKSFSRLTAALMGVREIIVLAAQPKVGKTTFVLQIESEIADQGVGVIHYDFENGRFNLMARECCRKFNIDYREELLNADWQGFDLLKERIQGNSNFAIITDRKLTVDKIRSHVFNMRRSIGHNEILITIDSLQKLPMENLRERRAAVDLWLRNFEELKSEDPNLTIILVSELSREGQKPKESGDIEYTGHFLLRLETD